MKDIRESISSLTPHGISFDSDAGRSTVAISELIGGMDWAMLLGMIDPRQAGLLLAKYCDDKQEERKVRVWWRVDVTDCGKAKGWKLGGRIDRMAEATMSEHLGIGTRCLVCNGTKERMINKLPVMCPACQGAGFEAYSAATLMDHIGITALEWDRQFRSRVDWCRRALHRWEVDAVEALRNKLGA